jgi:hypothetical protein
MWVYIKELAPKGGRLGSILILILLCIYPYVQVFNYIGFCQHKEQVIIEQTVCEGFTWNDENSYYDGVDYLNFSIDVSFKTKEVAVFNVHTLVFKGDKYIGYINSDFLGTSQRTEDGNSQAYFETNTKQTLYFHISHPRNTSWQNDALFKELYEGNLEEFTFVSNIICVNFTDGTTVGHSLVLQSDFYYDENGRIYYKDGNSDNRTYYYYDDNGKKHYIKNK